MVGAFGLRDSGQRTSENNLLGTMSKFSDELEHIPACKVQDLQSGIETFARGLDDNVRKLCVVRFILYSTSRGPERRVHLSSIV